jgi:hypothetical protein
MSPEYNGRYPCLTGFLEGNRPIFEKNGKCVWWHQQHGSWWVGPCEKVGLNDGYAYAKEDVDCPHITRVWRRCGSDAILRDVKVELNVQCASSAAGETHQSSATAPVNYIIRNGYYKQTCQLVYRRRKFRCS